MLNKWKKAVINVECATDREHFYDKINREKKFFEKFKSEEISREEFMEERLRIWEVSKDKRFWGTALFLICNSKRYLVTARHVVWDEKSAEREFREEKERTKALPENKRRELLQSARESQQNRIFSMIFRVPSYDENISNNEDSIPRFLMNLEAGVTASHPYTFSPKDIDLAIISLDHGNVYSQFADELLERGYKPISLADINDEPTQEGSEVFTVGFPGSISFIDTLNRPLAEVKWASDMYSLPAFAFGKVSMLNEELFYFWADMNIYPGNSGGPVIEDDKLVGIVIGGTLSVHPFGLMAKAKYLFDLIEKQEQKDNFSPP